MFLHIYPCGYYSAEPFLSEVKTLNDATNLPEPGTLFSIFVVLYMCFMCISIEMYLFEIGCHVNVHILADTDIHMKICA